MVNTLKKYILILVIGSISQNLLAQTTIASFLPTSGAVGTAVIITGANFNATPANNIVFFGATKAIVNGGTTTSLNVVVPAGATYNYISVTDIITRLTTYSKFQFVPTFSCGGSIGSNSFISQTDLTAWSGQTSVATGDLDGDGQADLVMASNTDYISIFKNISTPGSISFANKIDYFTGMNTTPISVSIGDLNGDGKPEIAVALYDGNGTVSVYKNTGTIGAISFAAKVDFIGGASNSSISIGDIDGNGKPDLVTASMVSNSISVLRNTGSGGNITFAPKVTFFTGSSTNTFWWRSMSLGDLDGDGMTDIAVVNKPANTISVLRNTSVSGTILFATKVDFNTGTEPLGIAIGDFDIDDKLDIVTANGSSNTISVLRNTSTVGNLNFEPKIDNVVGNSPRSISLGDIDGDGRPDFVVGGYSCQILKNTSSNGLISFGNSFNYSSNSSYHIAISDLDGDGKPDLIFANYSTSNSVQIRKNQINIVPSMTSSNTATICSGNTVTIPLTSDMNSTYSWIANNNPNTIGEGITNQSTDTLTNAITNTLASNQIVIYTVIPTSTIGSCIGNSQSVSVTVISLSQPTSAINATIYCSGSATITATSSNGGNTIRWYSTASSGTLLGTGLSYSAIFDSTTTLYAATYNSTTGCESSGRLPVIVTLANLNQPTSGTGAPLCLSGNATVSAIPATGGTNIRWYSAATGGTHFATSLNYSATFNATTTLFAASFNAITGCESSDRIPVIVTVANLNQPILGIEDTICGSGEGIISAIPASGGTTINWYSAATGGLPVDSGLSYSAIYSNTSMYYAATYNSLSGCESVIRIQLTITVHPLPTISSEILNANYGNNGSVTITVNSGLPPYTYDWSIDEIGDWNDSANQEGLSEGNYTLMVSDQNGCRDSIDIEINNGDEIFIPTGISPNGDGFNDKWVILGIDQFKDIQVNVFNLQGQCIYNQQEHYIPWDGLYNGVFVPVSDYYYVIESVIKKKKLTGAITVKY